MNCYDDDQWRKQYNAYIKSSTWKNIRKTLFKLRGEKCEKCGFGSYKLHIHHLTYERLGHKRLTDLQILCEQCHDAAHVVLKKERAYKQEDNRLQSGFQTWCDNTGKEDNETNFEDFCRWIDDQR